MKDEIKAEVSQISELDFETFEPREDKSATIKHVSRLQKVRQLDRAIGDSLKQLYDFRCQMTGERAGDTLGALVVEAHHIIPFTQSLNNDTSNIILLSPSYHRIIHHAHPQWNPATRSFHFPNGRVETLKLIKHLTKL